MAPKNETSHDVHSLAHLILTSERPVLMIGSSTRWGWNDTDKERRDLLRFLEEKIPSLDTAHVSDFKPAETLTFSSGVTLLVGIPKSRLELILKHLDTIQGSYGRVLLFDDHALPPTGHIHIDVRDHAPFHSLTRAISSLLSTSGFTPWGATPDGIAHAQNLVKYPEKRPDWKWDETKALHIPEEFRHDLAAGLDEHAE